jgi:hypothetical protein
VSLIFDAELAALMRGGRRTHARGYRACYACRHHAVSAQPAKPVSQRVRVMYKAKMVAS